VLFSIQDTPVLAATGLLRHEELVDNGGHQTVNSTFSA
jgi:hypothetical protein